MMSPRIFPLPAYLPEDPLQSDTTVYLRVPPGRSNPTPLPDCSFAVSNIHPIDENDSPPNKAAISPPRFYFISSLFRGYDLPLFPLLFLSSSPFPVTLRRISLPFATRSSRLLRAEFFRVFFFFFHPSASRKIFRALSFCGLPHQLVSAFFSLLTGFSSVCPPLPFSRVLVLLFCGLLFQVGRYAGTCRSILTRLPLCVRRVGT